MVARLICLLVLTCAVTLGFAALAQDVPPVPAATVESHASGKILTFSQAEITLSTSDTVPDTGWTARELPALWLSDEARAQQDGNLSAWVRTNFKRADFDEQAISIFTEDNRERLSVFVNGVNIFRNYTSEQDLMLGWNQPYLIPVPEALLKPGRNEIAMRVESGNKHALGFGTIRLGVQNAVGAIYDRQYLLRVEAPKTLNWVMLLLSILVFVMWLGRRQEMELLWLSLTGIVWFIRNYHFFADTVPFDPELFQHLTFYSIYFAVACSLAFCAEFLKLRHRKRIIFAMFAIGLLLSISRFLLTLNDRTDMASSLMTVVLFGTFLIVLLNHAIRTRSTESWMLLILLSLAASTGVHDIGRIPNIDWWTGAGFHFQPYIGFFLFMVFMLSLARRFLSALSLVEETNVHLAKSVKEATDALAASQKAQREMEVDRALETERERLMREMHDGIGSSLVTALAVARKRNDPASTIKTLQRAISDLKITVDSLAPVEGDVVTLLANIRHRMEQELTDAGIASIWKVEDCDPLEWMDASHSLHLLRLVQEALSNILQHAKATTITLACKPDTLERKAGLRISIVDDGTGLEPGSRKGSKGLQFMYERAAILNGLLTIESEKQSGTAVSLWLPLVPPSHVPDRKLEKLDG
ncbi:MAG: ATP-binding protein [Pseudomonadota bacterium]